MDWVYISAASVVRSGRSLFPDRSVGQWPIEHGSAGVGVGLRAVGDRKALQAPASFAVRTAAPLGVASARRAGAGRGGGRRGGLCGGLRGLGGAGRAGQPVRRGRGPRRRGGRTDGRRALRTSAAAAALAAGRTGCPAGRPAAPGCGVRRARPRRPCGRPRRRARGPSRSCAPRAARCDALAGDLALEGRIHRREPRFDVPDDPDLLSWAMDASPVSCSGWLGGGVLRRGRTPAQRSGGRKRASRRTPDLRRIPSGDRGVHLTTGAPVAIIRGSLEGCPSG